MKYSKLSHDIQIAKLNHEHELRMLQMRQNMELNELLSQCNHMYDDNSSAKQFRGTQWDNYYVCSICEKTLN